MAKSQIQTDERIRKLLNKRLREELGLSLTAISEDAKARGENISIESLSKYFSKSDMNNLSEGNIVWLCYRWGVYVTVEVGIRKVIDDKVVFEIPEYNEEKCLAILKKIFPKASKTPKIKK